MLRYGKRWTGLLLLAAAVAISGCARPRDDNLTAFSNATSALATAAKGAVDLDVEIDSKTKLTDAANEFAAKGTLDFPAAQGQLISGESDADWKAVGAFLDALNGYAKALSAANDPKLESGLSDKLNSLSAAISKTATARDAARGNKLSGLRQQRIQTIGGIVVDIVSIASNIYAGYEIQAAMKEVQPRLEAARAPLKAAIAAVVDSAEENFKSYDIAVREKLRKVRGDTDHSTFVVRYDTYVSANQDYLALQTRVAALKGLTKAIDAMISAHGKLANDLDSQAALVQFLQTVSDIVDKVEKAEALRKQT